VVVEDAECCDGVCDDVAAERVEGFGTVELGVVRDEEEGEYGKERGLKEEMMLRQMYLDNTNLAFDLELDVCVSFGRRHYVCEENGYVEDTIRSMAVHESRKIKRTETDTVYYCELAES
jgi:hypothetical protein